MKNYFVFLLLFCNFFSFSQSLDSFQYDTTQVYKYEELDDVPHYIGGVSELAVFIQEIFTVPLVSIEMGEQCCNIWLVFIVEIDGSVSNVKILKSESLSLGKEGIRVVKLLDKWNPDAFLL